MKTSSCVVAALALVSACSDGGGKKMVTPPVDAPMNTIDAAPLCSAAASFTDATDLALFYNPDSQMMVTGNQEVWRTIGDVNADTLPDWLWIELFEGPAPDFTTENFPATPFTVQITGNETDYTKCSTCVSLTTDVDLASSTPESLVYLDDYMATSGSVTINTLTPTVMGGAQAMISGTLNNINFAHVDISMSGTVPNASGCTSTLASLNFTAMAMPAMQANGRTGYRFAVGKNGKRPIRY